LSFNGYPGPQRRRAVPFAGKTPMKRQYEYRPKWTVIFLCALFFGACALVLGAKANGNDRGLIIMGMIELSPGGATVFYWVLAALSFGFVVVAGFLAIVRLTLHQRIALTETCITIPRSRWSSQEVAVPFGEIVEVSRSEISGQRFLTIVYNGGKFTLTASMLPKKADFDEIYAAVSQEIKASRPYAR
jgi:hypothetical protein